MALEPTAKLSGSGPSIVRRWSASVKHMKTRNAFSGNDLRCTIANPIVTLSAAKDLRAYLLR